MHEFRNTEQPLSTYLSTGAFLTSADNVMTVSWGMIGVMWGKKILVAAVRDSRYTKEFIDKTGEFTLSIPKPNEMKKEIAYCGSKSGRDVDKWQETQLSKQKAKVVSASVVGGCEKYYECKVLTMIDMQKADLSQIEKWYPTHDLHNYYFAEIVAEY